VICVCVCVCVCVWHLWRWPVEPVSKMCGNCAQYSRFYVQNASKLTVQRWHISAVLHSIFACFGWFCTKRCPTEQICSDTSGLAPKVYILRYNKVGCMSKPCRFFVQTVSITRLNTRFYIISITMRPRCAMSKAAGTGQNANCLFY